MVAGRYVVEAQLGKGGSARVHQALDRETGGVVALKELSLAGRGVGQSERALLGLLEFHAMRRLEHPGTVRVLDAGWLDDQRRFLVMELVPGEDLSSRLSRGPLPEREVFHVLTELAHTLAFIHARLYVHCDIKPENVRIDDAGRVRLIDFGVLHQLGVPASGRARGTLAYMAPEWLRGGIVDERTDLYSLGVLGFQLATGRLPFRARTFGDAMQGHLHSAPPRPSQLAAVSPGLEQILLRLLEKAPEARYDGSASLLDALAEAQGIAPPDERVSARTSYLHTPQLLGRERELARLHESLWRAQERASRALLVGAPAGMGKSRLFAELELDVRLVDVPYVVALCRSEGGEPLAPLRRALASLHARVGPHLTVPEPLRALIDERSRGELPDEPAEKLRLVGALTGYVQQLEHAGPFVLCFEDLHWASHALVELFNVTVRALDNTRGLVVGSFRSNEIAPGSLLFACETEGVLDIMPLEPLSQANVAAMLAMVLPGVPVAPSVARRLHEQTGGNPFFITESLRVLIERGLLRRSGGRWRLAPGLDERELPSSIDEAVRLRLESLPAASAQLLFSAAPAGRYLPVGLLRAISDIDDDALARAIDELIERQFLNREGDHFVFVHETVQHAIEHACPDDTRRKAHDRIASHLLTSCRGDEGPWRRVAYHRSRGERPLEAVPYLLKSADQLIGLQAFHDAYSALREADGILEISSPDDEARPALWTSLVELAYSSDTPATASYADRLFAHWARGFDLEAERRAMRPALDRALAARQRETAPLAELFCERPPQQLTTATAVFHKRAELRIVKAFAQAIMGQRDELSATIAEAVDEQPESSPYRAATLFARGAISAHTGSFRGLVDEMQRGLEVVRAVVEPLSAPPRRLSWALSMGSYFMNANLGLMGLPIDERASREGLAIAAALSAPELRIYHLFSRVVRAAFTGDAHSFFSARDEMRSLSRRIGSPPLPERNLAIYTPPFFLERLELDDAEKVIEHGAHIAERLLPGDQWLKLYVEIYKACLAAARERDGADAMLSNAIALAQQRPLRMVHLALVHQTRLRRRLGDIEGARSSASQLFDLVCTAGPASNPFDRILTLRELARLDAHQGQRDSAEAHLREASSLAERTGNKLQRGITLLARARLARRGASELLAEARRSLDLAAAPRWVEACAATAPDPY